jgi:hypothetical protein
MTELSINNQEIAVQTLRSVMADEAAPAAAKAQAARTLLELEGALGKHQAPPTSERQDLSAMSRSELLAELATMRTHQTTPET